MSLLVATISLLVKFDLSEAGFHLYDILPRLVAMYYLLTLYKCLQIITCEQYLGLINYMRCFLTLLNQIQNVIFVLIVFFRNANNIVTVSCSKFNSYQQWTDQHFSNERHKSEEQQTGEESLLLLYSRLAIKSFAFLIIYYLRNTSHTGACFFSLEI